ncbi:MAG: undecaprenyl/decaprenyl-phosphate alpha-N-acetylglucosaminyl 1-phosphate transferase [Deltaproteobacteria bacterium]|uniref:Undecaprenyl/decaprenyl-phosphate alpha-N-acetylglucosaminyl 1-phosphate transferase n=1 Tax=Candidatus Zymogenus saltonus TaxID=2844893 RepID=A0A9D8PPA9_9DELT|nr:undecaprenyl/decaprenyl-phosphate alpha-N-acetylglucosaminyl 1-phosphate transferase [Candidatus Zymogenus saltonus]
MALKKKIREIELFWFLSLLYFIVLLLPPVFRFFVEIGERWIWILLFSCATSYMLMPAFIKISKHRNYMDVPGGRKDHEAATPILGGVPIAVAFIVSLIINGVISPALISVMAASLIILVVGILEDIFGVKEWIRLLLQAAAFGIVAVAGVVLKLFPPTPLGNVLNCILTFIWIVGITNAMNFIDGLDGLCGGITIVISFFLGVIAFQTDQPDLGWLSVALLGGVLGFIPFNFIPKKSARIFLGDAGSSFLGFVLASLAVLGEWSENNPLVSFSTPLIIFGVLIYDIVYTNVARILKKQVKSFKELLSFVGRDHIHHRIAAQIGDRKLAVVFIVLINVVFGLGTIALRNADFIVAFVLVVQTLLIFLLITILEVSSKQRNRRKEDRK